MRQLNRNRQKGFTLLEMLVTAVILAFGLLGMAGLQAISLQNNNTAYFRTQANILAYDILDSMRANRTVALANQYNVTMGATSGSATNAIAQADVNAWLTTLGGTFPGGDGSVSCDANNVCVIVVQWSDFQGGTQQLSLSTEI